MTSKIFGRSYCCNLPVCSMLSIAVSRPLRYRAVGYCSLPVSRVCSTSSIAVFRPQCYCLVGCSSLSVCGASGILSLQFPGSITRARAEPVATRLRGIWCRRRMFRCSLRSSGCMTLSYRSHRVPQCYRCIAGVWILPHRYERNAPGSESSE